MIFIEYNLTANCGKICVNVDHIICLNEHVSPKLSLLETKHRTFIVNMSYKKAKNILVKAIEDMS